VQRSAEAAAAAAALTRVPRGAFLPGAVGVAPPARLSRALRDPATSRSPVVAAVLGGAGAAGGAGGAPPLGLGSAGIIRPIRVGAGGAIVEEGAVMDVPPGLGSAGAADDSGEAAAADAAALAAARVPVRARVGFALAVSDWLTASIDTSAQRDVELA
jgi:hypothetical protein